MYRKTKTFLCNACRTTRSIKLRERASPGSSPKAGPSCDDNVDTTGAGYNSGDEYDTPRAVSYTHLDVYKRQYLEAVKHFLFNDFKSNLH